jgi:hypothetical protein
MFPSKELKAKARKERTLTPGEHAIYEDFQRLTGRDRPLVFIWYLFLAQQRSDGTWLVPSHSEKGKGHVVDLYEPHCDCYGFSVHKSCSHLAAVARRVELERAEPIAISEPEYD